MSKTMQNRLLARRAVIKAGVLYSLLTLPICRLAHGNTTYRFNTVLDMTLGKTVSGAYVQFKEGDRLLVNGYHECNDDCAPEKGYIATASSQADGYTTHSLGSLTAIPIHENEFDIRWAGADPTGQTDSSRNIFSACSYSNNNDITTLVIPKGVFQVSSDQSTVIKDSHGNSQNTIFYIEKTGFTISCTGKLKSSRSKLLYSPLIFLRGTASWITIEGIDYEGPDLPSNLQDYLIKPKQGITSIITKERNTLGEGYVVKNCTLKNVNYNAIEFTNDIEFSKGKVSNIAIISNQLENIRGHGIAIRNSYFTNISGNKIKNVRRYDETFIGMGIDVSSGSSESTVYLNIIDNAPYGIKFEKEPLNEILSARNNRAISNRLLNIGHPDSYPDGRSFAIKVNSDDSYVMNNVIDGVYGAHSQAILVNRALCSGSISSNIINNVLTGICDIPIEVISNVKISVPRKRLTIENNSITSNNGLSAIELQWDKYLVNRNIISSFKRGLHIYGQPDNFFTDSIIQENEILNCENPIDIRGQLRDVSIGLNISDQPIILPYFMDKCRIFGNTSPDIIITRIGMQENGTFEDCEISDNHIGSIVISGLNLNCIPKRITINGNNISVRNTTRNIGIIVSAAESKNQISNLNIYGNELAGHKIGLHIDAFSSCIHSNKYNDIEISEYINVVHNLC